MQFVVMRILTEYDGLDEILVDDLINPYNPMATLNIQLENELILQMIYGHCIPIEVLVEWVIMAYDYLYYRIELHNYYRLNPILKLELMNLLTFQIQ